MSIVCIAEKPSVAKDIARVLGANQSHDGYYEGNGYQVTWTYGHLCELKLPQEYDPRWTAWRMNTLPMIPTRFQIKVKSQQSIQHQFAIIKMLFNHADEIINCGDAGIEGELIQRWVLQQTGARCPVKRLWISSLTDEAIREGFKHLKDQDEYQLLYEAGLARSISDWLLGMNATRYYTLISRQRGVVSVGRVQTPTLSLIVERQKEIDDFIPSTYYMLQTKCKDVMFSCSEKYDDKSEAQAILDAISSKPLVITKVENKRSNEAPPQLFDLTTLQVECNKLFGMSAEETLNTIQYLYEQKLATYPRVDTRYLSNDIYKECHKVLSTLYGYVRYTEPLLQKPLRKSSRVFDDTKVTDHHAIIPTGRTPSDLNAQASDVFDLIAKRFIAVFYDDMVSSNTTVTARAGKTTFKATGRQLLSPGWYEVYDKTLSDKLLPEFKKGESLDHVPSMTTKHTSAPTPYTEATLLRAMETCGKDIQDTELREALKENGIGRPSTRASIIETLFKRGYVERNKKNLVPTTLGKKLITMIQNPILKSAELTGQWEKKLRCIERGEISARDFINEVKELTRSIINQY